MRNFLTSLRQIVFGWLFWLAAILAVLEIVGFALLKTANIKLLPSAPLYDASLVANTNFYYDMDSTYGIWRAQNRRARYCGSCYDAVLRTNSIGANAPELPKEKTGKRGIFLGDSFWDGFGMEPENRALVRLGQNLGIETLPLTIGGAGLVQHQLIYQKHGPRYDHDFVAVGLTFPNDFEDNTLEKWKGRRRFRPYLVGDQRPYRLEYHTVPLEKSSYGKKKAFHHKVRAWLENYTFSYHFFLFLEDKFTLRSVLDNTPVKENYEVSEHDLDVAAFSIEQIKQSSGGKPVFVLVSPDVFSLNYWRKFHHEPAYIEHLRAKLAAVNVPVLTFESKIPENEHQKYIMSCTDHLSIYGNQRLAEMLAEALKPYLQQ